MAKQKTTNIVGRLITKVKSILTQVNANTTAIKALPTGGGGGGTAPTWKDITTTYNTRSWSDTDLYKEMRVKIKYDNFNDLTFFGFIDLEKSPLQNYYIFVSIPRFETQESGVRSIRSFKLIIDQQGVLDIVELRSETYTADTADIKALSKTQVNILKIEIKE